MCGASQQLSWKDKLFVIKIILDIMIMIVHHDHDHHQQHVPFTASYKGCRQNCFSEKLGLLAQQGGGEVWPKPKFLLKFSKTKFALVNG